MPVTIEFLDLPVFLNAYPRTQARAVVFAVLAPQTPFDSAEDIQFRFRPSLRKPPDLNQEEPVPLERSQPVDAEGLGRPLSTCALAPPSHS